MRVWHLGEGGTGGAGLAPATRERCSPESSALLAALLPTLAPAVVELDMLEARDTLWPESFITMARHRQKTPPVTDERARLATARETRKAAAGRFAGCWPSCKLRAVTGVYFWRGGRNQSNGGAETASLSTTEKRRVTEQRKYLEITRLGGEARSREQHKHPKRRFAHRTAAWASLRSNGEAETKDAARAEEQREKEEVWRRTSDEKALPSRPPCGDTVSSLCGPACPAAPASSDQGFTVRCRRWTPLEHRRRGLGLGAAWEGYSGPLLAVWIGRVSHGASPACTSTHELRACTTSPCLEVRTAKVLNSCWSNSAAGPSRLDGVQSAGARASCCRAIKWHAMSGKDMGY